MQIGEIISRWVAHFNSIQLFEYTITAIIEQQHQRQQENNHSAIRKKLDGKK